MRFIATRCPTSERTTCRASSRKSAAIPTARSKSRGSNTRTAATEIFRSAKTARSRSRFRSTKAKASTRSWCGCERTARRRRSPRPTSPSASRHNPQRLPSRNGLLRRQHQLDVRLHVQIGADVLRFEIVQPELHQLDVIRRQRCARGKTSQLIDERGKTRDLQRIRDVRNRHVLDVIDRCGDVHGLIRIDRRQMRRNVERLMHAPLQLAPSTRLDRLRLVLLLRPAIEREAVMQRAIDRAREIARKHIGCTTDNEGKTHGGQFYPGPAPTRARRSVYCAAGAGAAKLELKMSSTICHFPLRLRHTTMYLPLSLNGVVSSKCPRSIARSPLVRTSSVMRSTSAFPIDSNPLQNLRTLSAPLKAGAFGG